VEKTHRVLVFDFPGYGLSGKPPVRDYSLKRQLDAAEALMKFLRISEFDLLAHDMGNSVACELLRRREQEFDLLAHDMGNSVACELLRRREQGDYPFELKSLTLLNGGIYMELHKALLTQKMLRTPVLGAITARLTSWRVFRLQYPRVYANPEQFDEEHYRSQWALLLNNNGRHTLHKIAGYMKERTRMGDRWTGPLHRLEIPFRVIWGKQDPIAVHAIALELCANNPAARLTTLDSVGHYPQLEAPQAVMSSLSS
jgi:pimeloyl-ACP methyl ester carboxylesterase